MLARDTLRFLCSISLFFSALTVCSFTLFSLIERTQLEARLAFIAHTPAHDRLVAFENSAEVSTHEWSDYFRLRAQWALHTLNAGKKETPTLGATPSVLELSGMMALHAVFFPPSFSL